MLAIHLNIFYISTLKCLKLLDLCYIFCWVVFLQYPKCFHQCSNRGKSVILFNVMFLFIGSLFTNTSGTAEERWWFLTWSYFVQCFLPVGLGNWNASCRFPIGQVKKQSHTRTNTHFAMGSTMWMTVRWPLVIFYNPNWCISRQCIIWMEIFFWGECFKAAQEAHLPWGAWEATHGTTYAAEAAPTKYP